MNPLEYSNGPFGAPALITFTFSWGQTKNAHTKTFQIPVSIAKTARIQLQAATWKLGGESPVRVNSTEAGIKNPGDTFPDRRDSRDKERKNKA